MKSRKDESLHALIIKIAIELSAADFPNVWRCRRAPSEWWENLTTSDAWLTIHKDGQRLEIRADHPPEMERVYNPPSITISATRAPQAIARDILQRLAPDARAHHEKCLQATRTAKEKRTIHSAVLHKLEPFQRWKRTDTNGQRTEWTSDRTRADVYIDHVSELRIDSPTLEETIKILEILERARL